MYFKNYNTIDPNLEDNKNPKGGITAQKMAYTTGAFYAPK
jgi:hypothetical protein